MRTIEVVVGLGFGDEGKGTTVDWLARKYQADLVVRFNGGAQAGHNVVDTDGFHHCFAQIGAGALAGARTHLSRYMVVNPITLLVEAGVLRSVVDVFKRGFTVEESCLVTTPYHIAANRIRECSRLDNRHGSCGMGVGETVQDDLDGLASIRVRDLHDPARLRKKLEAVRDLKISQVRHLSDDPQREWDILQDPKVVDAILDRIRHFNESVTVVGPEFLDRELRRDCKEHIIFEGAQGVLLDQDLGFHPHTTWSRTTPANARDLIGQQNELTEYIGVTRAYHTRHGAGPFVTETAPSSMSLRDAKEHNQTNDWQSNFRYGRLDMVALRYAAQDVDSLVITSIDRLGEQEQKVCVAYRESAEIGCVGGNFLREYGRDISGIRRHPHFDIERQSELTRRLYKVEPVYEIVRKFSNMHYAREIARMAGKRFRMGSTGPTHVDKFEP